MQSVSPDPFFQEVTNRAARQENFVAVEVAPNETRERVNFHLVSGKAESHQGVHGL